jgi:ATP-binding protein involved in chromosome partitioning
MPTSEQLRQALVSFPDPETGRPIGDTNQLSDVRVEGSRAQVTVALTSHSAPLATDVQAGIADLARGRFPELTDVVVKFSALDRPPAKLGAIGLSAKSVIAVGSGKGGVGKSTIATTIALGLMRAGCKVGLMDADVYGPSIPHLLGVSGRPEIVEIGGQKKFKPIMAGNLPIMSMGLLVDPGEAVVWRGPMLHGAVTQFLRDTAWGDLDYLIIDMPPGTGDIALTLSQLLPLTGAVVVCTPQDVALLDAVKAIAMFRKVNIPILGMVENMSGFLCPDNGKWYDIFGKGGARKRAEELHVPFLGEVPINISIRENGDAGATGGNYNDPQIAVYLDRLLTNLARNVSRMAIQQPKLPELPTL